MNTTKTLVSSLIKQIKQTHETNFEKEKDVYKILILSLITNSTKKTTRK